MINAISDAEFGLNGCGPLARLGKIGDREVVHLYPNNLKNRFLAASAFPHNFRSHSRLAYRQWSLAPNKNSEEPPCQNSDSSGCLGISAQDRGLKDLVKKAGASVDAMRVDKAFMSGCMRRCGIDEIAFKGSYKDADGNEYSGEMRIIAGKENPETKDDTNKETSRDCDDRHDSRDHDYE
jgi:hypothetical protein